MPMVIIRSEGVVPQDARRWVNRVFEVKDEQAGFYLDFNTRGKGERPTVRARATGEVEQIDGAPVQVYRLLLD